jgi:hypothetical protein
VNPNDLAEIYAVYPRHLGKRKAMLEIDRAIRRLEAGETGKKLNYEQAVFFLLERTSAYARTPAGNRGHYTPHPTTWFHQSRYLDEEIEWQEPNKEEQEMLKRRNEANIGR